MRLVRGDCQQLTTKLLSSTVVQVEALRPAGLIMFTKVLGLFGSTENPDAEGILLVEDFVAQVTSDTPCCIEFSEILNCL